MISRIEGPVGGVVDEPADWSCLSRDNLCHIAHYLPDADRLNFACVEKECRAGVKLCEAVEAGGEARANLFQRVVAVPFLDISEAAEQYLGRMPCALYEDLNGDLRDAFLQVVRDNRNGLPEMDSSEFSGLVEAEMNAGFYRIAAREGRILTWLYLATDHDEDRRIVRLVRAICHMVFYLKKNRAGDRDLEFFKPLIETVRLLRDFEGFEAAMDRQVDEQIASGYFGATDRKIVASLLGQKVGMLTMLKDCNSWSTGVFQRNKMHFLMAFVQCLGFFLSVIGHSPIYIIVTLMASTLYTLGVISEFEV